MHADLTDLITVGLMCIYICIYVYQHQNIYIVIVTGSNEISPYGVKELKRQY